MRNTNWLLETFGWMRESGLQYKWDDWVEYLKKLIAKREFQELEWEMWKEKSFDVIDISELRRLFS